MNSSWCFENVCMGDKMIELLCCVGVLVNVCVIAVMIDS
jgi:hypothetical protein